MKKKLVCIALIFAMLIGVLAGCTSTKKFQPDAKNLAEGSTFTIDNKEHKNFNVKASGNKEVKIKLPSKITFNTILLNETTEKVKSVEFWIKKGDKPELVYKQDEVGGIRYCYLGETTTDEIVMRVFGLDGNYNLNKFELYNIEREMKDFRMTTYLPVDQFLSDDEKYYDGLNYVTDIILFGVANYDEKGDLMIAEDKIEKTLAKISEIRQNNDRKAKIYCTFTLASDIKNTENLAGEKFYASLQKVALKDNRTKLIENLKALVAKFNLDGIAFDYEFPYTQNDYDVFSEFLVAMKKSIPNKLISIAVAPWGLKFSKEAKEAVDVFELMGYDLLDSRGNHAGWQNTCVDAIDYMAKKGYPLEKVNLGVPFYSRPEDNGNYWGSWRGDVDKMGKFDNYIAEEFVANNADFTQFLVKGRWYNGENMLMDKTAYAFDIGCGGMMIWHYNCDVEYDNERSLLKAMNSIFK